MGASTGDDPNGPGIHTMPGGKTVPGPSTHVTNHTIVPLEAFVLHHLSDHQIKAIKLSTLTYARDVSTRLAQAYTEILAIIDV